MGPGGPPPPVGSDPWGGRPAPGPAPGAPSPGRPQQKQPAGWQQPPPPKEPADWQQSPARPTTPYAPSAPARSHRLRNFLLIFLAVIVVLLVVADRVAARVAASQIATQVQTSQKLTTKPSATVGGFPFLTQVVAGKYTDIGITIHDITTPGPRVDTVRAHIKGVHVPLSKAIHNDVKKVPVDHVVATVTVTYGDLNAYLRTQSGGVQLAPQGDKVRVTANVDIPIVGTTQVFGDVQLSVQNNKFTISPSSVGVNGLGGLPIPGGAEQALTVPIPISGLPFNLRLVSAKTTSTGISLTAAADNLVLDNPK